jgi:hypothetical protein
MASDTVDERSAPATVWVLQRGRRCEAGAECWLPVRTSLKTNSERCQDFRTACPTRSFEGRVKAVAKAGRRQHSKRFELATRISRVAQTWSGLIGTLFVFWASVCLRVIQAARRFVSVQFAHRDLPTSRSWVGRTLDSYANFAASVSPRRQTPGFRCLTRVPGELPSRRGLRHGCGASCDDGVDPRWEPCHTIEPPGRERPVRGLLV